MNDVNQSRTGDPVPCVEFADRLMLLAGDDLEAGAVEVVETHLRGCSACSAAVERERKLVAALRAWQASSALEPTPGQLAQCRSALGEALDDAAEPRRFWQGIREQLIPGRWFAVHPALTAALLLLVGIFFGRAIPGWVHRAPERVPAAENAAAAPAEPDLRSMDVSSINWQPGSGNSLPNVEVHLTSERPMVVRGTVDNPNVQSVLLYVMRNDQRFDSGARLDSVELLRERGDRADVRKALCQSARRDPNTGVRLKALEALRGFEQDDEVRQTLLEALVRDTNPGVRIEAVNALRQLAESGKPLANSRVRQVLEDRMQHDPNNYIRLQSAAAVRQLGPRQSY